jgi:hypothetical protein
LDYNSIAERSFVMGAFKDEEVLGYMIDGQCVCRECVTAEEEAEVGQGDVIVENDNDDSHLFCDRCQKRIH